MSKQTNQRQVYWAAVVDWSTLDVYVRQKRVRPSIAEKYSREPSPVTGNVYAKTEADILEVIPLVLKAQQERIAALLTVFKADTIPCVYTENKQNGAFIRPGLELPAKGKGRRRRAA